MRTRYGWTRGDGKVSEHETSLAEVLEPMLVTPGMWVTFADAYLDALDVVARADPARKQRIWVSGPGYDHAAFIRKDRVGKLARWHGMLADHLVQVGAGGSRRLLTVGDRSRLMTLDPGADTAAAMEEAGHL